MNGRDFIGRTISKTLDEFAKCNFQGKNAWLKEKKALNEWRDVRAYDAVDLEQWLEQSLPAQTWLMRELGQPTQNIRTLLGQLVGGDGAPDGADVF